MANHAFLAYPSKPAQLGGAISAASEIAEKQRPELAPRLWGQAEIAGAFIIDAILEEIHNSNKFYADITYPNFNVAYELGFAIALQKPVRLFKNSSLNSDWSHAQDFQRAISTIGYEEYANSTNLATILCQDSAGQSAIWKERPIRRSSPIYYARPMVRDDFETQTYSRIKKTRLGFNMFDPLETSSFVLSRAMDDISGSAGVILHLLPTIYNNSSEHNMLSAFVLGLSHGSGKITLCLQQGTEPVPIDYRDLVDQWSAPADIHEYIAKFAMDVSASALADEGEIAIRDRSFLESVSLGASAAENELQELQHYFLETHEYQRCLRGDVQVIHARKGSGKTAIFAQVRSKIRRDKQNVVLDLQPEGYQLMKLKDLVLLQLSGGTREHSVVAFWEYLLYLEIANKLIQKDRESHRYNHEVYECYRKLEQEYSGSHYESSGDFAERLSRLINSIQERFSSMTPSESEAAGTKGFLNSAQLTQFLYSHDFGKLQELVMEYLALKNSVWILFDNLDKGWPAQGLTQDDALMIRSLIEAINRMTVRVKKAGVDGGGIVFIRSDVFDLVVDNTSDRGKIAAASIDWVDESQLRELLRRRLVYYAGNVLHDTVDFKAAWSSVCVPYIDGEETSQYFIDRCIMRPRSLIDFFQRCLSHAVNLGKEKIDADDILHGEDLFSSDLVRDIGYEIRDVFSAADDILYCFIGASQWVSESEYEKYVSELILPEARPKALEYLLRIGFFGAVDIEKGEERYIFDFAYNFKRLWAWLHRSSASERMMCINPAFWRGLDITPFR